MKSPVLPIRETTPALLSVVVPVFNEQAVLQAFHERLGAVLETLAELAAEVLYVDDGSSDESAGVLARLRADDPRVGVIRLSRNFGKEAALAAGLEAASGTCVVVIDADLQHPPEAIPAMVNAWRAGADVVNMRRKDRADESWRKRRAAGAFYWLLHRLSDLPIEPDVGDFRLFSRQAVDALNLLKERARFTKGLATWIGFEQVTLGYDCAPRAGGASKWHFRQLLHLAMEGITAFSVVPLRLASHLGLASALLAFAYAAYFFVRTLLLGDPVAGFPTLIVVVLMLGGLQLLAIGVLGEYLGRLAIESKQRPLYLVRAHLPPRTLPAHAAQAAEGPARRPQRPQHEIA